MILQNKIFEQKGVKALTSELEKIKGIIFDFDGVIVDSIPAHLAAWDMAYKEIFKQDMGPEKKEYISGMSTNSIAKYLCKDCPQFREKLIKTKNESLRQNNQNIEIIAGAMELLKELRQHQIPHGIVSNAPKKFIESVLVDKDIKIPFFFGREDYYRPKPDPEPYLKGLKELGFGYMDRKDVVFFEDSPHGLESGKNAGLYPIGISSQHHEKTLKDVGAQIVFKDHLESIDFILSRIN